MVVPVLLAALLVGDAIALTAEVEVAPVYLGVDYGLVSAVVCVGCCCAASFRSQPN